MHSNGASSEGLPLALSLSVIPHQGKQRENPLSAGRIDETIKDENWAGFGVQLTVGSSTSQSQI